MDTKTREALEASIKHWERNVAAETPNSVTYCSDDCALCELFYWESDCRECPVSEKTGQKNCGGSPYMKAVRAAQKWESYPDGTTARDAWRAAAQAMLDFLISLRPEGE